MTEPYSHKPKLLFVLSNDYGELFNAMYFLAGMEFQPVILMPPRLFAVNQSSLSLTTHCYQTTDDVLDIVGREAPDVVFLFSGYLYVINRIFDPESMEKLVVGCRSRNVKLVTSDPSLGILSDLDSATFSEQHPARLWLQQHFLWLVPLLKDMLHLYLAPTGISTNMQWVSFFNPHIVSNPTANRPRPQEFPAWQLLSDAKRQWLFILSPEDYGLQVGTYGQQRVHQRLLDRLRETHQSGRQPVLIAPQPCLAAIEAEHHGIDGLVTVPACDYPSFMALLNDAEYVFYWNMFSASIVSRVLNRLPFLLLDRGHLVHAMRNIVEVGYRHFYPGCQLEILGQDVILDPNLLADMGAKQEQGIQIPVVENLVRSPSPDNIVKSIL